jgi:hypothetical protein
MTTRLDTQRPPAAGRTHTRKNSRWYQRGYDNVNHPVWGDTQIVSLPGGFAYAATAGVPGAWVPAGSTPPSSVANLQGGIPVPVVASPSTGWTTGQYVQTGTAGAPGEACWTGTSWVGGKAP